MASYKILDSENGETTTVYDLDKCLESIRIRNKNNEDRIKLLENENKKLKEEYSKDLEIKELKNQVDKLKKDCLRGFPISEDEKNEIKEWEDKHDREVHKLDTVDKKIKASGCIGGKYHFVFIPTSIGTIGTVVCQCGEEFVFKNLE